MALGHSLGIGFQNKFALLHAEALDFIETASITDLTEKIALIQLVTDLKSQGFWDKMDAIYPFVGGTAAANSYNLKNTSQNKITWYGSVTHDSNGITGDGTSGYGDTFHNINSSNLNNFSLGLYSKTNNDETSYEIGAFNSSLSNTATYLRVKADNLFFSNINSIDSSSTGNTDSTGFFGTSRMINTHSIYNIRGTSTTNVKTSDGVPNLNLFILGLNFNGSLFGASSKNIAFCYFSQGLTASELSGLATIVQNFQITLGRQV